MKTFWGQKCARTFFSYLVLSAFGLASLSVTSPTAWGQERFSDLSGVATDATGAVVPGVKVTATNKGTGRVLEVITGTQGSYSLRQLEPGHYSVRFEAAGFNTYEVGDVNLLLGKELRVDGALKVGSTGQTVEVSDAAPLIDVSGTTIAQNITSEEFDRLPKSRSFQSLALASPSVNSGQIEGGIQINGASGAENQFNIDGISTNSIIDGRSRQNAIFEILQEVQVKTGGIEAEYGGALGGVISAITKSGGNAFHGDVHYYFTSNKLSAAPVQRLLLDPSNETTTSYVQDKKQKNDQHEPGYSLGGYFLKDKLWFFSAGSPGFVRRSNDYLFSSGKEPATFTQDQTIWTVFNKLSWDATKRIRTNFTYLWSPTRSSGSLPAYNYQPNSVTSSLASNLPNKSVGFSAPQSNYTGTVDIVLTPTSLLSIRGARFWDDYKTTGIPGTSAVVYQTSATNLPFDIPAALRQPVLYQNTPRLQNTFFDLGTRTYIQADYSKSFRFLGSHDLKVGGGDQKNVNKVNVAYPGGGYVYVYWDKAYKSLSTGLTQRGTYGYYEVDDTGTHGSTGANQNYLYIQDHWRIHPRVTLSLGLRTEKEVIPSFRRDVQDTAFSFGFADKMAPRLGASWDVHGDGKLKVYGSYGRFFDWVKYELARGTFGGDYWTIRYRALDTTDVFSLNGNNTPGANLWNSTPGSFRDRRVPGFQNIDPNIKPMGSELINAGVEYQLNSKTVVAARYVHNNLRSTIEDLGVLVNGDEVYKYANPGEGIASITPTSGLTKPFTTPKPVRVYDAMELSVNKRFGNNWFGSASYVYSRLYGNYAGLASSDEINTPTTNVSSTTTQQSGGSISRPGSSATRSWDIDEILWDSHGNLDVKGRLATDRPHVVKLYGSYFFKWGTEVGGFFYGSSGTPMSTVVNTLNQIPVFVNGRGDMGRTPILTQTDLVVAHEVKFGEVRRLRFEFNGTNLFNQQTARHIFNSVNRGAGAARASSAIDLSGTDLAKGYDYKALINASAEGKNAFDPRFGMSDLFNPGFAGRLLVKFIF
jgi:hypothetical protein